MAKARKYEGSAEDNAKDRKAAKKAGMSMKAWEKTAADKRMDKAAQAKLDRKRKKKG